MIDALHIPPNTAQLTDSQLKTIDVRVGACVRARRVMLGLTQMEVSRIMGLTVQQLQKYEHGTNRISAARLAQLAMVMSVPVSHFFEDALAELTPQEGSAMASIPCRSAPTRHEHRMLELLCTFYGVDDGWKRDSLLRFMMTLGRDPGNLGFVFS